MRIDLTKIAAGGKFIIEHSDGSKVLGFIDSVSGEEPPTFFTAATEVNGVLDLRTYRVKYDGKAPQVDIWKTEIINAQDPRYEALRRHLSMGEAQK